MPLEWGRTVDEDARDPKWWTESKQSRPVTTVQWVPLFCFLAAVQVKPMFAQILGGLAPD